LPLNTLNDTLYTSLPVPFLRVKCIVSIALLFLLSV
jgi:hypothetical protein